MANIRVIYELQEVGLSESMISDIDNFEVAVIDSDGCRKKPLFGMRDGNYISKFVGVLSYKSEIVISLPKYLYDLSEPLSNDQERDFSRILVATLKHYDELSGKQRLTTHKIFNTEQDVLEIGGSVSAQLTLLSDYFREITYSAESIQTELSGSGVANWEKSEPNIIICNQNEFIHSEIMTDTLVNDDKNEIVMIYRKIVQHCYNELKRQGIAEILDLPIVNIEPNLTILPADLDTWGAKVSEQLKNENLDSNKKALQNIINYITDESYSAKYSTDFRLYGNLDFCYIWENAMATVLGSIHSLINRDLETMKQPIQKVSRSAHKLDVFFQTASAVIIADAKYMDIRESFVNLEEVTKQYMYEVAVRQWFQSQPGNEDGLNCGSDIGELHNVLLFPKNGISDEYVELPYGKETLDESDVEIPYIKEYLSLEPIRCLLVDAKQLFLEYTGMRAVNDRRLRDCLLELLQSSD